MKGKILVLLVSIALLVGFLSGCIEDETEEKPAVVANTAPEVAIDTSDIEHNVTMDGGTVTFTCTGTDADENATLTYSWDFGDSSDASTDEDPPVHIYALNGSYEVIVTISDGTDTGTDTVTVVVGNQAPIADFTYAQVNLTVTFTDASTDDGTVSTWSWAFGDGNTSTVQNPEFTYAEDGDYIVTLTVTDEYDSASAADSETITVAQEVAEA